MQTLNRPRTPRAGFSLAELMVVIVILGLLATIVVPNVFRYLTSANITVVKSDIGQIAQAIDSFMIQNGGKQPDSLDVLEQADENGNAFLKRIPNDPWKNPYVYEPGVGSQPYLVISYGKDGAPGGEGEDTDITNMTILERK
jgi:general secretion pathway protein G